MAIDPRELLKPWSKEARAAAAPTIAGNGPQRAQRVQIGLFGLFSMVLIVALADIITSRADETQASAVPEAAPTVDVGTVQAPRDPLTDAGVVPNLRGQDETPRVQPSPVPPQESGDVPPPSRATAQ